MAHVASENLHQTSCLAATCEKLTIYELRTIGQYITIELP